MARLTSVGIVVVVIVAAYRQCSPKSPPATSLPFSHSAEAVHSAPALVFLPLGVAPLGGTDVGPRVVAAAAFIAPTFTSGTILLQAGTGQLESPAVAVPTVFSVASCAPNSLKVSGGVAHCCVARCYLQRRATPTSRLASHCVAYATATLLLHLHFPLRAPPCIPPCQVGIDGKSFLLSAGDHFFVPATLVYSLQNLCATADAAVFFVVVGCAGGATGVGR